MSDRQCSSCGGNCGGGYTTASGNYIHCKQEIVMDLTPDTLPIDEWVEGLPDKKRIAELQTELEKYSEYTICDCCQSLTLEPVDAGGHMQCVSCTKLADCSRLKALIRAHISKRDWPADLVGVIEERGE